MSQMGAFNNGLFPPGSVVQELTGNTGGPVGPDASNNINIIGTGSISVAGNPAIHTLTISLGGTLAESFPTDSGTAIPAAGVLNVFGGTLGRDINTSGSGNTIHIDLDNAITLGDLASIIGSPAITLVTGDLTISAGDIHLPNTTSDQLRGVITYAGNRFINNFGDRSTWVGNNAGNPGGITSASDNTGIGNNALNAITTGNANVAVGSLCLDAATSSLGNACVGYNSCTSILTTGENSALGYQSLQTLAAGQGGNVALGSQCMRDVQDGIFNVAVGNAALQTLTTGGYNIVLGKNAASNYTTTESSNIIFSNSGILGESNTIRIGTPGSGSGQQNRCFVAGIDNVNVGNVVRVVTESGTQLGTADLTAGTGISITPTANVITIATSGSVSNSFPTDSGTATPSGGILNVLGGTSARDINTSGSGNTIHIDLNNTITLGDLVNVTGSAALTLTTGNAVITAGNLAMSNTTSGNVGSITYAGIQFIHNFGDRCAWIGSEAGNLAATNADDNNGHGYQALHALTTGDQNNAMGSQAGLALTSGANNDFMGYQAAKNITSGSNNVIIGSQSGFAYTTSESSNILFNNLGVIGESNTLRIGFATGSSAQNLAKAYICGIDGVNVGSVAKVVTMASDQLGTATITAGTGITVTPGANTITIAASGTTSLTYTNVSTSPYVVLTTDEFLSVDTSSIAITVQLPNAATSGRVYIIKDRTGAAATRNITVTTVGGAVNIDGATTFVMNTNYQAVQIMGNGSTYELF